MQFSQEDREVEALQNSRQIVALLLEEAVPPQRAYQILFTRDMKEHSGGVGKYLLA